MAYENVMKKSYIFLIEHPVSLGNGSYYTGKVICKWQFVISFYAERFPAALSAVLFIVRWLAPESLINSTFSHLIYAYH